MRRAAKTGTETVKPETENWLTSAQYDLETARGLLGIGRYVYVVFMCHLAIEKTLKALVCETTGASPPRTHDLRRLVGLTGVTLEPHLKQLIDDLTDESVETRYPDDVSVLLSQYDENAARACLNGTTEVIACLRADPRLRQS